MRGSSIVLKRTLFVKKYPAVDAELNHSYRNTEDRIQKLSENNKNTRLDVGNNIK